MLASYTLNDFNKIPNLFITQSDEKQTKIQKTIYNIFPNLISADKKLLEDGLTTIINFIILKMSHDSAHSNLIWQQLVQNDMLDLKAALFATLPFINDNEAGTNKRVLTKLADLYTKRDVRNNYMYTNSQYNRCVKLFDNDSVVVYERPYLSEYYLNHIDLMLATIETVANKLYVNWVDVLPITMNEYVSMPIYTSSVMKFIGKILPEPYASNQPVIEPRTQPNIITYNNYIDPNPGISIADFYNVLVNHLYNDIAEIRWLLYDIKVQGKIVQYVTVLGQKFNLDTMYSGKMWSQLSSIESEKFKHDWSDFFNSVNVIDNNIMSKIYLNFAKYHTNSRLLIQQKLLILTTDYDQLILLEDDESITIEAAITKNYIIGMQHVPINEIYTYLYECLNQYKRTWYYYVLKQRDIIVSGTFDGVKIKIEPKYIYNWCKSFSNIFIQTGLKTTIIKLPQQWISLNLEQISMATVRLYDIPHPTYNTWDDNRANWFNINAYIRRIYPEIAERDLFRANKFINDLIRTKIISIVFESMIYKGLLSKFVPNPKITDRISIARLISNQDETAIVKHQLSQISTHYLTKTVGQSYANNSYYWLTGKSYADTPTISSSNYKKPKTWFEFLSSDQNWTFTYAMNWLSQINFYHRYINNRVIYVTGSTGVGKSTQIPKLIMYCQKMIDYNWKGRTICSQPRISPTVDNAQRIAAEMGVPIKAYDPIYKTNVFTSNYYVQYDYKGPNHISDTGAFLRIVTDGKLYKNIESSLALTKVRGETITADNIYDAVIVDEAHEHNANMDMILTLMRNITYINNSIKLVIVSATMDDDEPIYRRYYRTINDNRIYPLNNYIVNAKCDRANVDRRIHISPPGKTTRFQITNIYEPKNIADKITDKTYVEYGIAKTILVANSTTSGDILLFMAGQRDILKAIKEINAATPSNVIALGFFSEMSEADKTMITRIHLERANITKYKEDILIPDADITRRVKPGTYTRTVIIATNVAEASLTLQDLIYVIDTGYAKVNIYDPIYGISKMLTLPISYSSAAQRTGRVGRVGPGTVYHLYDLEKVINNKTSYKIADSNIQYTILNLSQSVPDDEAIISDPTDINSLKNLRKIMLGQNTLNVSKYENIVKKKYIFNDGVYYTYYGVTDYIKYDLKNTVERHKYMLTNHDDYDWFSTNYQFTSKASTGYDISTLTDRELDWYLIHPDENIISRNMYTGSIKNIKCSESVSAAYYYYFLKLNNIETTPENVTKCIFPKINDIDLIYPKISLAMADAKQSMLAMDIGPTDTILTPYMAHMKYVQKYFELDIFNNLSYMSWFTSLNAYPKLQFDVLAVSVMLETIGSLNEWVDKKPDMDKFIKKNSNANGDVYFAWLIWREINKVLLSAGIDKYFDINKLQSKFRDYKTRWMAGQRIEKNISGILFKLYNSNKLNIADDYFWFVSALDVSDIIDSKIINSRIIVSKITAIANRFATSINSLMMFIQAWLSIWFELNKNLWLANYRVMRNLIEDAPTDLDIETYINKYVYIPSYMNIRTDWDYIYRAYIMAFGTNLLYNKKSYYISISRGVIFEPNVISPFDPTESTLLNNNSMFVIYHSQSSINDDIHGQYLTPVNIKELFHLNPLYWYYALYDDSSIIRNITQTPAIDKILTILKTYSRNFDPYDLNRYIEKISDPVTKRAIIDELAKLS